MIVRRFLLWARHAPAGQRAEAVRALAGAYLAGELSPADHAEAETALTVMLDDLSPLVRGAMAEILGGSEHAPRHLVVALAADQGEVSSFVLSQSPVLIDEDLVDCAAMGDARIQCAIALRPYVSAPVSAALAEVGEAEALVALVGNPGAHILDSSFARMVERHGEHGALREALLARTDLPIEIVQSVAAAIAASLSGFVTGCGWLSSERSGRVAREARDRATVALAGRSDEPDLVRLVAHLRRTGQLTPVLLLRALLSGRVAFAEASIADLAGYPRARVSAILHDRRGAGFRALYARAGLPGGLRRAFEATLAAVQEGAPDDADVVDLGARLSRPLVARALAACARMSPDEVGRVTALLRRFDAEAALADAHAAADALIDEAERADLLEAHPDMPLVQMRDRIAA